MCGRGDDLHVDHAIPIELAKQAGFDDELIHGDARHVSEHLEPNSVSLIVTSPPSPSPGTNVR
jgi:hypothetical protein